MSWKCVPQVLGLTRHDAVRRDGKGQSKHRANYKGIIHEAFEIADQKDGHPIPIRKTRTSTYDRNRTPSNRYSGYQTADDVAAALEAEADAQTVEVATTDKKTGEVVIRHRPLRSDAVIGVAVIFKPPCEVAATWSREKYDKFYQDALEVMSLIQCGGQVDKKTGEIKRGREACHLFSQENIIAMAEHWDEGTQGKDGIQYTGHWHVIYKPEDESGKYRGALIDGLFCADLNKLFPAMMRERGWDIADCDCTDWDRYASDTSYKAERRTKRSRSGRSVNKYISERAREEVDLRQREAQDMLGQAAGFRDDARQIIEDANAEAAHIRAEAEAEKIDLAILDKAKWIAESDRDAALRERDRIVDERVREEQRLDQAHDAFEQMQMYNSLVTAERDRTVENLEAVRKEFEDLRKQTDQEREALTQAQAAAAKAAKEKQDAESAREAAEAATQTALNETKRVQASRDTAQCDLDALRVSQAKAKAELDQLQAAKTKTVKEKQDAESARDTAQRDLDSLTAAKAKAKAELDQLQDQEDLVRFALSEAQHKNLAALTERAKADEAAAAARSELEALRKQAGQERDALSQAQAAKAKTVKEKQEAESARDTAQRDLDALRTSQKKASEELGQLQVEKAKTVKEKYDAESARNIAVAEAKTAQDETKRVQAARDTAQRNLDALRASGEKAKEELGQLQAAKTKAVKEKQEAESARDEAQGDLNKLQAFRKKSWEELNQIHADMAAAEKARAKAVREREEIMSDKEALQDMKRTLEEQVSQLKKQAGQILENARKKAAAMLDEARKAAEGYADGEQKYILNWLSGQKTSKGEPLLPALRKGYRNQLLKCLQLPSQPSYDRSRDITD